MHVLIVDDELSIRETFQAFLEEEGYDVSSAADFFEAESLLADRPCDVVVADIIMPRVSGLSLLQRVREIDAGIPVIMITGEPDVSTAAEAVRHGAYDYIAKPVTQETLTRVVGRAAERKRLLDEKRRLEAENLAYQADLEKRVAKRTTELKALVEISRDSSATLDPTEVMEIVAENVVTRLGYKAALVSFYTEEDKSFTMGAVYPHGALLKRAVELVGYDPWKLKFPLDPQENPGLEQLLHGDVWLSHSFHDFVRPVLSKRVADAMQRLYGTRHNINAPMWVRGKLVGSIIAARKTEIDAAAQEVLMTLAHQAGLAIENARLFEEARQELGERKRAEEALRERATRLELIARVGQQTTAILELDELLDQAANLIGDAFGYYNVSVLLVEGDEIVLKARTLPSLRPSEEYIRLRVGLEGIAGWVAGSGEPLLVPDVSLEPRYCTIQEGIETKSEIAVPIKLKEIVIGVLDAQSTARDAFSQIDVFTLQTIADQLAVAIENTQLYEGARRHVEELTALHNIDVAITSILDLDEVLWIIYEQISETMDITSFYIGLYDEEKGVIYSPLTMEKRKQLPPLTLDIGENGGLSGWVVRTRKPLWVEDMEKERDTLPVRSIDRGVSTRSIMMLPLIVRDKVIGVISAQSKEPHAFDERDRRLFTGIASQAAIAVENARLFEETNRRLTETLLLQEVMQAATSTLDFDQVLTRTLETLHTTLHIDYLGFALPDESKGLMVVHPSMIGFPPLPKGVSGVPIDGSILGRVYQTGEPLLIPDVRQVPYYFAVASNIRSELTVPVRVGDEVIAVLNAESAELAAFDEDDLHLFTAVAAQLGVVLENARLFEETDRRLAETRLLQEMMQAAASTLDFDEVLTRTIETLHRTLSIDYLTFVLPDERGDILTTHPSWIGYPFVDPDIHIPIDRSVTGHVYQTGEPQIIPDVREEPRYFGTVPEIRSELAAPVKVADRVIAVLDIESSAVGAFGEDDLHLFSAIAAQLGIVLENARLFEETKRRLTEARLIQEVMLAAASTLDFDLVLERTVKALHRALGIHSLSFLLPNERDGILESHPSLVGFAEAAFQVPIEGSLVGRVYRSGRPILVQDLAQEPAYQKFDPEIHSLLAVPVRIGERIAAVLHAESPQVRGFNEEDLLLFTTVAGQLGVTLENARLYRELQEINRLRAELVQNVGHELRTPLGLVKGYVELLLDGDLGPLLDSQRSALQIMRERTATLSRLIHNLTTLQTLPRETLSPVSIAEVMQRVLEEFRLSAEKANIAFVKELAEELPSILGDQELLNLAFGHLIDNGIKFSPDGGAVTIRAWADRETVYVSITDEGIGISAEHVDRIFERFYQVDGSASRRFGGMGVGLALVSEIIDAHGGAISVESEPGEGSTFTIVLPQAKELPTD